MRVLIVTPLFPPDIGGPAVHAKLLYDSLPARGIAVEVISFGGVRHLPKIVRHIFFLFALLRVASRADIVYALDPVSVGLPALVAARLCGKKFILRIAGDYAWEQGTERFNIDESLASFSKSRHKETYPFILRVLRTVERYVAQRAARVVVPSAYLKWIIENWDVSGSKIDIVYNGIVADVEAGNRETLRELLKVRGKLIVSAGRLVPLKGFMDLILTAKELRREFPEIRLCIVGEGPQKRELERLIEKNGLLDTVILAGGLDQDVFFRYIKASDVFVLNSWHETFSHVLLETMAIGTPIVATKVGGTPEIIEHEKEGILIPPRNRRELANALRLLLSGSQRGEALARAGKQKVKLFSKEREIDAVISIFHSL
jgi:glycosyltransferase involved in cell wall biosynthesis